MKKINHLARLMTIRSGILAEKHNSAVISPGALVSFTLINVRNMLIKELSIA